MATYRVECRGNVREVYMVEADSEEQAMATAIEKGFCAISEAESVEPVSAQLEED